MESDSFGRRKASRVVAAIFKPRHYRAALMAIRIVYAPVWFLVRYAFGAGHYPSTVRLKTPIGTIPIVVNSSHDLRTIHEVFCALDYRAIGSDTVVVDYGSNIGVSAAYFLSRSDGVFVYMFEPLERNIDTLRTNVARFAGRYLLRELAVGLEDGKLEFGWEPTGRYGGIGRKTGNYVTVNVRKSREILKGVIAERGRVDILKIDIEGLERKITEDLAEEIAEKIERIYVEHLFDSNPLESTHDMSSYGTITRFVRRSAADSVDARSEPN